MDIELTYRFVERFKPDFNLPLRTLSDFVIRCQENKKPLVIYLHNEYDSFSSEFVSYITQDVIDESNFVIWDLNGEPNIESLVTICSLHLNCDLLQEYIRSRKAAVFVFKYFNSKLEISMMYDGDTSCDLIINQIFPKDNAQYDSAINTMSEEEMDTCEEDIEIDLHNETLNEVLMKSGLELMSSLEDAVNTSIAEIRPLLIYIHNSSDTFSKSIWSLFTNKDINNLFREYTFYAWDMNNTEENFKYYELSMVQCGLSHIKNCIKKRSSCLLTFSTVKDVVEISGFFDGTVKREELLFELYNIQVVHAQEKQAKFTLLEKVAVMSAIDGITSKYDLEDLPFAYGTIEENIQKSVIFEPEYLQKMMLIFYYNEEDFFCKKFLNLLRDNQELSKLLCDMFLIVPIDVATSTYTTAIKSAVKYNFNHPMMEKYIDKKQGALYAVTSTSNRPELLCFYTGDFSVGDLCASFRLYTQNFEMTRNITDVAEKNVCKKFIETYKPSSVQSCYLNYTTLHTAIEEYCLCLPIKKRKMLLLYYDDPANASCSQLMSNTVQNFEVQSLIKAKYYFLGWQMNVSCAEREKLCLALKRNFALEKMEVLFKSNIPGIYIFMPIGHTLALFDYIDGRKEFGVSDVIKKLKKGAQFLDAEKLSEVALQDCKDDGPIQFQQLMFNQLGDRDYDCIELETPKMEELLKKKLSYGLFGPPAEEEDKMDSKVKKKQTDKVNELYKKILEQVESFAQSNEMVVWTCIFNCLIPLPKIKVERLQKNAGYNPNLDFVPVPVFILRKCVNCPEGKKPCRVYIDHDMRVYQSWEDYLEENQLPKGIFIVPKDGRYQGDHFGRVRIEYKISPACEIGKDILKAVDIGTAVVGTVAGVVGLAALIPAIPVAPVIATSAIVTGIGVGIYSLVRSSITLHDRFCHDESMSLANSQARGAYLNLLAGSFSFTGLGATFMLSYFVKNGATVGLLVRGAVNGLNGINVVTSGVAVANSAFDILYNYIEDDETPSTLAIVQLTSSILFFGHAVYSFKSANEIITEAQYKSLQEIEASLRSNRHRKTFSKLKAETIRVTGDVQKGQAEVIMYMKELNNRDEVLATLTRTNKELNQSGIRYSVKDGKIQFNGKLVDIGEFSNMSKLQRSDYMLTLPPKQDSNPVQYQKVTEIVSKMFTPANINNMLMQGFKVVMEVRKLSDCINIFSAYVQEKIIMFVEKLLCAIDINVDLRANILQLFGLDKLAVEVLNIILKFFKENVMDEEMRCARDGIKEKFLEKRINTERVVYLIEKAVIYSSLSIDSVLRKMIDFTIKYVFSKIFERASDITHRQKVSNYTKKEVACKICSGVFYN